MRIGRYEIDGKLGEGGMGVVYRATDPTLGRDVAIKIIRREALADPESRKRFDHEAIAAGMLKHPGVVTIYDRGEYRGHPYLVMELVEGRTLDVLLKEGGLTHEQTLSILRQVAAALDYAHSRRVVHRDIKPSNIIVQPDGAAKIMDFGIAKAQIAGDGALTTAGMVAGSPWYTPPERFFNGAATGASDLWSLAATAYEALIGRRPFQAGNLEMLLHQICYTPPPEPTSLNADVPVSAGNALLKALSKKPDERFKDCSTFVAELAAGYDASPAPTEPAIPTTTPEPRVDETPPTPKPPQRIVVLAAIGVLVLIGALLAYRFGLFQGGQGDVGKSGETKKGEAVPPILSTNTGDMVLVPGGTARLGENGNPVEVDAFYIDKTEVPVGAYRRFCEATGRAPPEGMNALNPTMPVVNVNYADGEAFAAWAGKRLPSGREWEKAARGPEGLAFPWGNDMREGAANLPKDRAAARNATAASVTSYPEGASPFGALNLIGNVFEWTSERASAPPEPEFTQYRSLFKELSPPLSPTEPFFQVRGGSFRVVVDPREARRLCWDATPIPGRARKADIGFRCVRLVEPGTAPSRN